MSSSSQRNARKSSVAVPVLLLFVLFALCLALAPAPALAETFAEKLARMAEEARKKLAPSTPAQAPESRPVPAAPPPVQTLAPQTLRPAVPGRQPSTVDDFRNLMAQGRASGGDLAGQLVAMRTGLRKQRAVAPVVFEDAAADQLAAPPGDAVQGIADAANSGSLLKIWQQFGGKGAERELRDRLASGIAFGPLDDFLGRLTEDRPLLERETVLLPSPQGLTDGQVRRVVRMATLVLAARATKHVLEQAKKDIAGIEDDYRQLIDRREKAAALFYEVVGAKQQAQRDGNGAALSDANRQLGANLSREDTRFLEADLSRLTASQFVNDLAAQNLAINYLRQRDPAAYADYTAQRDGTLKRTRGYLRTLAGAAAVAGLTVAFVNEVRKSGKERNGVQMVNLLTLGGSFVGEATNLAVMTADTGIGALMNVGKSFMRFRVETETGTEEVRDAAAAFKLVKKHGADHLMVESLFRSGAPGLVQRVQVCDGAEAGRMLDTAIPARERREFAEAWFGSQSVDDFAFVNALGPPGEGSSQRERELSDRLMKTDYRGERDQTIMPLGRLQERLGERYDRLSDEQLMRMIFANREGTAALATLQLGNVSLRPMPSMESIYVYESLIESCRSLLPAAPAVQRPLRADADGQPPPAATPARPNSTTSNNGNNGNRRTAAASSPAR